MFQKVVLLHLVICLPITIPVLLLMFSKFCWEVLFFRTRLSFHHCVRPAKQKGSCCSVKQQLIRIMS